MTNSKLETIAARQKSYLRGDLVHSLIVAAYLSLSLAAFF